MHPSSSYQHGSIAPTIDVDMTSETSHEEIVMPPQEPEKPKPPSCCSYTWWAWILFVIGLGFLTGATYMQIGVCAKYSFTDVHCNTTSWREASEPYRGIVGYVTYTSLTTGCKYPERDVYTCSRNDLNCLADNQFNYHQPNPWPCFFQDPVPSNTTTCDPGQPPYLLGDMPDTNKMWGCQMRTGFFIAGGIITGLGLWLVVCTYDYWEKVRWQYH